MGCTIADFRDKEVINICDGRRLGYVIDVEFDTVSGQILSIVVPGSRGSFFCIGKTDELFIDWCRVKRIGDDTILVDIGDEISDCGCDSCERKKKRR